MTKSILTKKILYWYDNNKRSLPWRKKLSQVKREYYTLVSEFMLQQTQVATVIPYFNNFIKDIPDIKSLSKINENKLYSRFFNQTIIQKINNMLYANLKQAKSEEDVKDAYIKALGLKGYTKGLIDIQAKEIWFEAKDTGKNSSYAMFTQLLHYVQDALN